MTRMLNSKTFKTTRGPILSLLLVMMLSILASCMPQSTAPGIQDSNSTATGGSTSGGSSSNAYSEPTFPLNGIFIQEGATQSLNYFSLPINFTDSFMVRGLALSKYLRSLPNTTRFCLVGKYTYSTGNDRFLVMSAKPKSYTDLVKKTTEFYLLVEPSNDAANQNDCLTYNLTNSIFVGATAPTASFSLNQLCATCNSSVTSEGLKLYFNNGEAVPTLNLSLLNLTIAGSTTSSGNACVENTLCQARNFDCCLDGQCVKDGAIKPGALTDPGFAAAQMDVASNPNRFVAYPQYYFVCTNRPEGDGSDNSNEPIDPNYEATIRLMELNHLYQCLNKVDGEFSYCTIKYTSASQKINAGTAFSPATNGYLEDINFQNLNPYFTGDYANNIVKIFYGGQVLYEANKKTLAPLDGSFLTTGNDDISTAQSVKITKTLPSNALDDNLYLTFKVDGTCEKLGASLARCTKTYVHKSALENKFTTSYHDDSRYYELPVYADTSSSSNIIVRVSGIIIPEDVDTWTKEENPSWHLDPTPANWAKRIVFKNNYLFENQTVEITYYVNSGVTNLTKARSDAQAQVNSMCLCGTTAKCNLAPIYNSQNAIVNYECSQGGATSNTPPANQTVFVSNKNIPHRYYDANGVSYDNDYSGALAQEGTVFGYTSNNVLKPTNVPDISNPQAGYTGFNEIYGSFSKTNPTAARPAKVVQVKKDTIYDLFTNSGVFSTCLTCGSDYYSSIQKIFPQSFTGIGGGYSPDKYNSSRISNPGIYRSDDLLFGRACFVPATMIPWTHNAASSVSTQRRNRLAGQHFMFANGYNRDWFGFDYGSLIGSFDGITWFSVGNKRRIKATSNKLFLAVNAYYGDLNTDSNFNVTVSETTQYSPAMPDHDTETDGAECQQAHFCATDNDCFRQLGYDYTCQNVSSISTKWPQTDANGTEVIGSITKSIVSIVGGANGQSKRCIYRGRGAPCHPNLTSLGLTFNNSSITGSLACSPNNMCQSVGSGDNSRFNDRIARFANTPFAQNSASAAPTPSDTVGLGARILGRPYDYYGTKTIPGPSTASLNGNGVTALCIPGKNIAASNKTFDLNLTAPLNPKGNSDKVFGIGPTMAGLQNPKYLNACPATDNLGYSIQHYDLNLADASTINVVTTNQNLSTNLLDIQPIVDQKIFSSNDGSPLTTVPPTTDLPFSTIGYQRNACLRAPGASCFSDMDCAPSEFIANKVKNANLAGILNPAEEKYWEEELICGNPEFKYVQSGVLSADYDIKKNVCCRDFGKTFTNYTQVEGSAHEWCDPTPGAQSIKVAGINTNINSYSRYSRVHTGYDKMTCNVAEVSSNKSFALSLKVANNTAPLALTQTQTRYEQQASQYKTLDLINQRTCCTKNWVRNFAPTNGGGHTWGPGRLQTFDKANFKSLNWIPNVSGPGYPATNVTPYYCDADAYNDPTCEIRDFSNADTDLYLKFFGALELAGIPQVALMTDDHVKKLTDGTTGFADFAGSIPVAPPGTVKSLYVGMFSETGDFRDSTAKRLYSAANPNALEGAAKKVFSDSEFSCCIPSGTKVPDTTNASQCCTGYLANQGSSTDLRCCLPDFTDLTVYLSRYVSSEGRGLPDSAYDPNTGYIKDPAVVEMLAAQKRLCCGGTTMRGVAIRKLPIPINGDAWVNEADAFTRRFVYLSTAPDNNPEFGPIGSVFDNGVRWNNHVYCVRETFKSQVPAEK